MDMSLTWNLSSTTEQEDNDDSQEQTTHSPGEILLHEFIEPLGLTQKQLAEALGVTRIRVNQIIRGKRGVTLDTAFRLSRFFGTTVDFWMGLQADVDMWDTLSRHGSEYERIKPIAHAANE